MSVKKYYTDSYITEFESRVTLVEKIGNHFAVALEESYFYPTSGGQEHDLGEISGAAIESITENESGEVLHILESEPSFKVGDKITGNIEWKRRFENMQQHTGQHLLSAAFENLFGITTHSSRLGNEVATLDLATAALTESQIREAEQLTNQIIWENRSVKIHIVEPETLHTFKLRVSPKVSGAVRIIEVPDFDLTPCGGTHVNQTGEIGIVKVTRTEKLKQGITRLEFHCGQRVIKDYHLKNQVISGAVQRLSVPTDRILEKIDRLISESKELEKELASLRSASSRAEATAIINALPQTSDLKMGSFRLWIQLFKELRPETLQTYADSARKHPKCFALLGLIAEGKVQLIVSRSPDLEFDCSALLKRVLTLTQNGKGGGRADNAQGSGAWIGEEVSLETALRTEVSAFISSNS